jgi:drug/metabolite transporter (DMT)-like permease
MERSKHADARARDPPVTSVAFGVVAALVWGGGTLALRSAARAVPAQAFSLWFNAYNAALLLPLVVVAVAHGAPTWSALAVAAGAGVAQAAATIAYGRALAIADVVVVGPLVALEGAFAAVLAIVAGRAIDLRVASGLVLVTLGGIVIGMPKAAAARTAGAGLAVVAAAFFGVVLWLVGSDDAGTIVMLMTMNTVAAVLLGATSRTRPSPRALPVRAHAMLALGAALNLAGLFAYAAGAHGGSLPVTAVLAAQFAIVAVAGGYVLHGERLAARQLGGALVLLAGVSALAVWG